MSRTRVLQTGIAFALAFLLLLAMIAQAFLSPVVRPVSAQAVNTHGIGFAKGCDSPVDVGDPYNCGYLIANGPNIDTPGDTLIVSALSDVVHAAAGDVLSPGAALPPPHQGGNLLPSLVIASYVGGAQCFNGSTPLTIGQSGATTCVLPTNSAVAFARQSFYTVAAGDLGGDGLIDDDAVITFTDTCSSGADDCPVGSNFASAGASAPVNTPTPTPTNTPTATPTATNTPTPTNTPVPPTATPTNTPTATPVPPTATPTNTPTNTPVPPTATPTNTATPTPVAANGCTPGFWKQDQHFSAWTGFTQSQTLESVFDVPDSLGMDDVTLLEALDGGGGPGLTGAAKILFRASVAALLNSSSASVDYSLTTAQITAQVNTALASGDRATMLALASDLDARNNAGECTAQGAANTPLPTVSPTAISSSTPTGVPSTSTPSPTATGTLVAGTPTPTNTPPPSGQFGSTPTPATATPAATPPTSTPTPTGGGGSGGGGTPTAAATAVPCPDCAPGGVSAPTPTAQAATATPSGGGGAGGGGGVPGQFSVTPPAGGAGAGGAPAQFAAPPGAGDQTNAATTTGSGGAQASFADYCHYEPSTEQWENRRTTDLPKMLTIAGNKEVMQGEMCAQDIPQPVATRVVAVAAAAVVAPAPVAAAPQAAPPAADTVAETVAPVSQPLAPTATPTPLLEQASPPADVPAESQEVPVQIP